MDKPQRNIFTDPSIEWIRGSVNKGGVPEFIELSPDILKEVIKETLIMDHEVLTGWLSYGSFSMEDVIVDQPNRVRAFMEAHSGVYNFEATFRDFYRYTVQFVNLVISYKDKNKMFNYNYQGDASETKKDLDFFLSGKENTLRELVRATKDMGELAQIVNYIDEVTFFNHVKRELPEKVQTVSRKQLIEARDTTLDTVMSSSRQFFPPTRWPVHA